MMYYFVVRGPFGVVNDDTGVDLPSEADAREFAVRFIQDLNEDNEYTDQRFEVSVRNDAGAELFVIPLDGSHIH
jgi:hypothetical protein